MLLLVEFRPRRYRTQLLIKQEPLKVWVYDPSIPGNELVKLDDNVSGRSEDKNRLSDLALN